MKLITFSVQTHLGTQTRIGALLGDKALAEKYHQQALNLNNTIEQQLSKAGARLLHLCASETLETQLHRGVASWIR